jgi:hypothetical protein
MPHAQAPSNIFRKLLKTDFDFTFGAVVLRFKQRRQDPETANSHSHDGNITITRTFHIGNMFTARFSEQTNKMAQQRRKE